MWRWLGLAIVVLVSGCAKTAPDIKQRDMEKAVVGWLYFEYAQTSESPSPNPYDVRLLDLDREQCSSNDAGDRFVCTLRYTAKIGERKVEDAELTGTFTMDEGAWRFDPLVSEEPAG